MVTARPESGESTDDNLKRFELVGLLRESLRDNESPRRVRLTVKLSQAQLSKCEVSAVMVEFLSHDKSCTTPSKYTYKFA